MATQNLIMISEDDFVGIESVCADELLTPFTCLLCYGIAIDPHKCKTCEQVYCSACLPKQAFDPKLPVKYPQKRYECYKKCGSKELVKLSRLERNLLNGLFFKCQHADSHGCEATVTYERLQHHLENECVHKVAFPKPVVVGKSLPSGGDDLSHAIQVANLPDLFKEEGDEVEENPEWRFIDPQPAAQPNIIQPPPIEFEDIDMGNLFGDDNDY